MKKHLLLSLVFAIALAFQVKAQTRECAAHEIHEEKMATSPEYAKNQQLLEQLTQNYMADLKAGRVVGSNVVIPCIVHVVYANTQENISDAQIQSQIDRLNKDFAATNSDYNQTPSTFTSVRSGDTQIRFELIETKRYSNSRATWGTNDLVKSTYPPIEPARILNMWVADIGGGILGYAQFPGGAAATDGVVMSPQYFGDASVSGGSNFYLSAPFNLGRTATHEVGHWLNLRHIWGDGGCSADDLVSDTPIAGAPNYGCPAAGTNTCAGGLSDMFMNYMDYVDDACMFMFSAGQKARMNATFSTSGGRGGFLQDPTYVPGGGTGGGGGTPPVSSALGAYSFEGSLQGWADGGSDCKLYSGSNSFEGNGSVEIRDNSGTASSVSSPTFAAGSFASVQVEFYFYAISMENGEDFWVQASTNGGSTYSTVATYASGTNFNNNTYYVATVTVPASNSLKVRFRCDASNDADLVYIDKVTVTGVSGGRLAGNTITDLGVKKSIDTDIASSLETEFTVYPNPASSTLNIRMTNAETAKIQIFSINGQLVKEAVMTNNQLPVDISTFQQGIYILKATTENGTFTKRFVKQ